MSSPPPCVFTLPLDSAGMKTYLPVNFVDFLTKRKKLTKRAKKIVKGKYCWLSLVFIDKKQNLKLKLSIF